MKPRRVAHAALVLLALAFGGCAPSSGRRHVQMLPPERFDWVAQPIEFSPPPARWYRDGAGGGGLLGVRFILSNGGGQVMSVAAYKQWSERLQRKEIVQFLADFDRMEGTREALNRLSLLRLQLVDPLTPDEARTAAAVNDAVDRAERDVLDEHRSFVRGDIEAALRAVDALQPALADLLPSMRLRPERQQHPEWWVLGFGRDSSIAGVPAYVSYDTLALPEQKLLYQQVFWVAGGNAFQAVYQGRPENQHVFEQMVESVRFPEKAAVASR
jgi:hypothetical protein